MASGSYVVSKVVTFLATLAIPSVAAGYGLAVALVNEVPDVAQVIPANRDSIFLTLVMGLGIHYINRNTPDKKETQHSHSVLLNTLERFAYNFDQSEINRHKSEKEFAGILGRVEQKVDDVVKRVDRIEEKVRVDTGEIKKA